MPKMATSKSTKKIDSQKACRLIYKEKTRDLLRPLMRTTIGDKSTEGIVTKNSWNIHYSTYIEFGVLSR